MKLGMMEAWKSALVQVASWGGEEKLHRGRLATCVLGRKHGENIKPEGAILSEMQV